MTTRVYKNFVEGTLASGIAAVDTTSMSVTFATNATVPVSSDFSSKHIYFVIDPEGAEHAPEIVKGTAISGSGPYTITITRAQNGTSAQVWDSGRKVVAALIEEDITNFATKDGTTFTGNVTIPDGNLILGSTAVSSTAAELNILDGATVTTAEINYLDDDDLTAADLTKLAAITSSASELNILDGVTADATEINVLDGVTGGTVTASKALVVDGNKDLASLRNVTLTGTLTLDSVGITAVTTSGETFADNDTSLLTAGAVVHRFLQYDVDGGADAGATLYIQASAPYADGAGGGVKGDIWIDT